MFTRKTRSVSSLVVQGAALVVISLLPSLAAEAGTKLKGCYAAADDWDGDGYARTGAAAIDVRVDERAINCPGGYVNFEGDRNDFNAAVHPRTREIGYNGVDDNCNGLVDEPTVSYSATGLHSTTTSAILNIHLNNSRLRNAALAENLWATVEYFRLRDSARVNSKLVRITSFTPQKYVGSVTISGLSSGTVYAFRLTFSTLNTSTMTLDPIGPNADIIGDGEGGHFDMERYYTMTDSDTSADHKRFLLVVKALAEFDASNTGEVGYRGTEARDGTRYGADAGRKWCTEFYSWVTGPRVEDMGGLETTDDAMEAFRDHTALYRASQIPTSGAPGDYLPLDNDQDGEINHSALFLAYDTSGDPSVWTVEGNKGNRVKIVRATADWDKPIPADKAGRYFRYLGHIEGHMWR